jgi:glutamate decarboxylase
MFNFLNLGFEGYRRIALADLQNARLLSRALELSGYYKVLSNIHIPLADSATNTAGKLISGLDESDAEYYQKGLPVVSFRFSDEFKKEHPHVQQAWMQVGSFDGASYKCSADRKFT